MPKHYTTTIEDVVQTYVKRLYNQDLSNKDNRQHEIQNSSHDLADELHIPVEVAEWMINKQIAYDDAKDYDEPKDW